MINKNLICRICSSKNISYFDKYKGNFFNIDELIKCNDCKVIYASPFPSAIELYEYYSKGNYYNLVSNQNKKLLKISQKLINNSRMNFISTKLDINKISSVLDIGSGNASLVIELKNNNSKINYDIVEPDKFIFYNNSKYIRNIFTDIDNIKNEKYDLIIVNFVMEHLIDPLTFMKKIRMILKKNSHVYIEIPNSEYLYKKSYTPHLFFWNLENFKFFIKVVNFKIIYASTFGMKFNDASLFFNHKGLLSKLFNFKSYKDKILRFLFPEKYIRNSDLFKNLNSSNGDRNWIKVLINNE